MWLPLYNNYRLRLVTGGQFHDQRRQQAGASRTATRPSRSRSSRATSGTTASPVDAQDLLFDIALIKAAVDESAANWGSFTPGYFPQSLASVSASEQYTVVLHLKRAFNPGFFLNDQLALNLYPTTEHRPGTSPRPTDRT